MRTKTVRTGGERTVIVAFDKGDEAMSGLQEVAEEHGMHGAGFTAIGAFRRAVLGYFDRERGDYDRIPVDEQVEVVSLIGDVAVDDGRPAVHGHAVLGRRDGTTVGGHLLEAHVWPTLEVVIRAVPAELRKSHDPETGLALFDL